jgi:cytochrome P450
MNPVGYEVIDPLYYERYGYPHAAWAYLRQHAPVAWFEPPDMRPFWAITKYADLSVILRDHKRFKIAPRIAVFRAEEELEPGAPPLRHLLTMDPPEHGKYRTLMAARFQPRALESKRAAVSKIVDEVIDRIADQDEVDFVQAVAAIVPLAVIAEMFGLPREDWSLMFQWSNALIGPGDPEYQQGRTARETSQQTIQSFFDYFRRLSEQRRRQPGDDFVSVLANAEIDGQPIHEFELLSYFILLIVAGNETTRNATSGGLLTLMENPAEFDKLRRNMELLPSAVEEILRWVSPVIQFCRTASEDIEIRGEKIRAGEALCVFYPSANRDEEIFADPFSFRIDRQPNEHYAFGIGVHFCLGANLARLELQEIFRKILTRFTEVELAGPVERLRSSFVGGIKRMPIRYRLRA